MSTFWTHVFSTGNVLCDGSWGPRFRAIVQDQFGEGVFCNESEQLTRRYSPIVDKITGIQCDQTVVLSNEDSFLTLLIIVQNFIYFFVNPFFMFQQRF
jgi:hypothetical protein